MSALAVRIDGVTWWYDIVRACIKCKCRVQHLANAAYTKRRCSKCYYVSTVRKG